MHEGEVGKIEIAGVLTKGKYSTRLLMLLLFTNDFFPYF